MITRLRCGRNGNWTTAGPFLANTAGSAVARTKSSFAIGPTQCSPGYSAVSNVRFMVPPTPKPRRVLLGVTLATIAIFGGLVALMTWQLRERLRDAVLRREAEAIHAVALMQLGRVDETLSEFDPQFAIDDLFAAVLESSKLRGVLAVQLFDSRGTLRKSSTVPAEDAETSKWWP